MATYTMLDLCSGFGGASEAPKRNGWRVIRLDIEPRVSPDIIADVLDPLPIQPGHVDFLWCSPVCREYSRFDQPGLFPGEPIPSFDLWRACERHIREIQPRYWLIENVRGAVRFHGRPTYKVGPYHFWTNIPILLKPVWPRVRKWNLCSGTDPLRGAKRGYIPYPVSDAIRLSVEYLLANSLEGVS